MPNLIKIGIEPPDFKMTSDIMKKEKARFTRIKRVYGLSKEDYEGLKLPHCPICERTFDDNVKPVIDHDHRTGAVRGILCFYCNHRIVGRHRDAGILRRVADYLEKAPTGFVVPKKPRRKKRIKK